MSFYHKVEKIQSWRVILMACAAFVFNTTEYVPIALLSDIAESFSMTTAQTGLMVTVYAWTVLTMSLPGMLLTGKMERRGLLIKLFLLFIASHILSVIAWNYWILLLSRIGIALAHSIFWSITASLVMRVAPKTKKTQALGMLAVGTALATILGLPLGRLIGQVVGWRVTFAIIGALALVIMLLLMRILPNIPSKNAGSLASLPALAKRPLLLGIYGTVLIVIAAHFTAYTYIEPFMLQIGELDPNFATAVLLIFGVSGLLASLLFNRLYRLGPAKFIVSAVLLVGLSLALLYFFVQNEISMVAIALLWGIGISCIGLSMQMRVLQLAPDATDVATAIFSGIYNAGIGAGALLGNQIMNHIGLQYVGFSGAIFALLALLLFLAVHYKYRVKA
jgi:predicted arabinose transporter